MKQAKKVSMQIYLDPKQQRMLAQLSKTTGKTKAALIRQCIDRALSELPPGDDPAMDIIGLGSSGRRDISEIHDDYLVKATEKEA